MPDVGLTKSEILFIDEYFCNGFNATKAYRTTYKVKTKKLTYESCKYAAYRAMNKLTIKLEIDKRWGEIRDLKIIELQEITITLKELLLKAIEENDTNLQLKTIDIINKMQGNYTTIIDATIANNITLTIPGLEIPDEEKEEED